MASYWPHDDLKLWVYQQHYVDYTTNSTEDAIARLWFDGTTVAPTAIQAQLLTGDVTPVPAVVLARAGIPAEVTDPLLRRLWLARPDLRQRIREQAADRPCPTESVPGWIPLFIAPNFAWVQDDDEIAAWRCTLADTRAWLWLTNDLSQGHISSIQLVPDLADNVFLILTVAEPGDVMVPAGTYPNSLRIDYRVDYGESACLDQMGNELGIVRAQTLGFVYYAEDVGPVQTQEEFMFTEQTGDCGYEIGTALDHATLLLKDPPSVPAAAASWGKVKAAYR